MKIHHSKNGPYVRFNVTHSGYYSPTIMTWRIRLTPVVNPGRKRKIIDRELSRNSDVSNSEYVKDHKKLRREVPGAPDLLIPFRKPITLVDETSGPPQNNRVTTGRSPETKSSFAGFALTSLTRGLPGEPRGNPETEVAEKLLQDIRNGRLQTRMESSQPDAIQNTPSSATLSPDGLVSTARGKRTARRSRLKRYPTVPGRA